MHEASRAAPMGRAFCPNGQCNAACVQVNHPNLKRDGDRRDDTCAHTALAASYFQSKSLPAARLASLAHGSGRHLNHDQA